MKKRVVVDLQKLIDSISTPNQPSVSTTSNPNESKKAQFDDMSVDMTKNWRNQDVQKESANGTLPRLNESHITYSASTLEARSNKDLNADKAPFNNVDFRKLRDRNIDGNTDRRTDRNAHRNMDRSFERTFESSNDRNTTGKRRNKDKEELTAQNRFYILSIDAEHSKGNTEEKQPIKSRIGPKESQVKVEGNVEPEYDRKTITKNSAMTQMKPADIVNDKQEGNQNGEKVANVKKKSRDSANQKYVPPSKLERNKKENEENAKKIPLKEIKGNKRRAKKKWKHNTEVSVEKGQSPCVEPDELYEFTIDENDMKLVKELEIALENFETEESMSNITSCGALEKFQKTILPSCVVGKVLFKLVCKSAYSKDEVETLVLKYKDILVNMLNGSLKTQEKKFLNEMVTMNMYLNNPRLDECWTVLEAIWDCFYEHQIIESQVFIDWIQTVIDIKGKKEVIIGLSAWFDWIQTKKSNQEEEDKSNIDEMDSNASRSDEELEDE